MKENREMNRETVSTSSLPPRRVRHPKPKSVIDNPRLPFVVFLVFLTILIIIFVSHYYSTKPAVQEVAGKPTGAGKEADAGNSLAGNVAGANGTGSGPAPSAEEEKEQREAEGSKGQSGDETTDKEDGNRNEKKGSEDNGDGSSRMESKEGSGKDGGKGEIGNGDRAGGDGGAVQDATRQAVLQKVIRYTVQPGDTLFSIAMKFYGSQEGIRLIQKENRLSGNTIYAGMKLRIPNPKKTP